MNKIILLLLFFTNFACSVKIEKPIPEKPLEGWAGNPDNPNEKPFDYFYMKSIGRASEKTLEKKKGAMLYTTCVDAATTKVKGDLIGKIIKDCSSGATPIQGNLFPPHQLQKLQGRINTNMTNTVSQIKLDSFNTINLAAFADGGLCERQNTLFICELAGTLGGVGIKECKPTEIQFQVFQIPNGKNVNV